MGGEDTMSEVHLTIRRREGALVRMLGLAERRGYTLTRVNAKEVGNEWVVDLAVQSERPPTQLLAQLLKLHDVSYVELRS